MMAFIKKIWRKIHCAKNTLIGVVCDEHEEFPGI
jgi:hypothetical protein